MIPSHLISVILLDAGFAPLLYYDCTERQKGEG